MSNVIGWTGEHARLDLWTGDKRTIYILFEEVFFRKPYQHFTTKEHSKTKCEGGTNLSTRISVVSWTEELIQAHMITMTTWNGTGTFWVKSKLKPSVQYAFLGGLSLCITFVWHSSVFSSSCPILYFITDQSCNSSKWEGLSNLCRWHWVTFVCVGGIKIKNLWCLCLFLKSLLNENEEQLTYKANQKLTTLP